MRHSYSMNCGGVPAPSSPVKPKTAVVPVLGFGGVSVKNVFGGVEVGDAAEEVDGRRRVDVAGAVDGPHLEGEQALLDELDLPRARAAVPHELGSSGSTGWVGSTGSGGSVGSPSSRRHSNSSSSGGGDVVGAGEGERRRLQRCPGTGRAGTACPGGVVSAGGNGPSYSKAPLSQMRVLRPGDAAGVGRRAGRDAAVDGEAVRPGARMVMAAPPLSAMASRPAPGGARCGRGRRGSSRSRRPRGCRPRSRAAKLQFGLSRFSATIVLRNTTDQARARIGLS